MQDDAKPLTAEELAEIAKAATCSDAIRLAEAALAAVPASRSQERRLAIQLAPEAYRDGWRAGAEAMREKAAKWHRDMAERCNVNVDRYPAAPNVDAWRERAKDHAAHSEMILRLPIPDPPEGT